ncbi:TPR end-of-group domain-containing protein [Candidatus Lokiarchaeum ossiferum]|uniref:TPR end-of-group domain-containing protein n=1 Tax=Candidatus Lokiarchaeum ossiferum TaxID=2951803 RepID=UPI00352F327A
MSLEEEKHNRFKKGQMLIKKAQKFILKKRYSKARELLYEAQEIFEFTESSLTEGQVFASIAETFEIQHMWDNALKFYQNALEKRKIAGSVILLSETHRKLAIVQMELKNFEMAHASAQKSIDLVENLEHPLSKAEAFHTQGIIYLKELDYESALFYENFAYENVQIQLSWNLALDIFENLAFIHYNIGDYSQSNIFCKKALEMEQKQRNYVVISTILELMALNYRLLGKIDQALTYIKDALSIQAHLNPDIALKQKNKMKLNYATILFDCHKFSEAEIIAEELIEQAELSQDSEQLVQGLLVMVKIIMALPTHEEFSNTKHYLEEAKKLAHTLKNQEYLTEIYIYYGRYYDLSSERLKAEEMYQLAIDTAMISQSKLKIGEAFEQFGLYFHKHKKMELAHTNFKQAVQYLSKTHNNMDLAEAHYNLACTCSVLHLGEDILTHLSQAINLDPKYKQIAKMDEDFTGISTQEVFRNLVE